MAEIKIVKIIKKHLKNKTHHHLWREFFLIILLIVWASSGLGSFLKLKPSYALNNVTNWDFNGNATGWTATNGVGMATCGVDNPETKVSFPTLSYNGSLAGQMAYQAISGTATTTSYRAYIKQTIVAPGTGTVRAKGKFSYYANSALWGGGSNIGRADFSLGNGYFRLDLYDSSNTTFVATLGCTSNLLANQGWQAQPFDRDVYLSGGTSYVLRVTLAADTPNSGATVITLGIDNIVLNFSPNNLTTSAPTDTTKAQLSWPASTAATGANAIHVTTPYKIYRSTSSPVDNDNFLANVGTNSYLDTSTSPRTNYYYTVTNFDTVNEESPMSAESLVRTRPAAPTALNFTNINTSTLRLNWTAPTGGANTYKIERCTGTGCTVMTQIASGTATTYFDDSGLGANTIYRYKVRATDSVSGDGPYSSISSNQVTLPEAPNLDPLFYGDIPNLGTWWDGSTQTLGPWWYGDTPYNFTQWQYDDAQAHLYWPASTGGANYYKVYRCDTLFEYNCGFNEGVTEVNNFNLIGTTTNTTYYDDSDFEWCGLWNFYRLKATNEAGDSVFSAPTLLSVLCIPPPTLTTLPATAITANSATLNGYILSNGGPGSTTWFHLGLTTSYTRSLNGGGLHTGYFYQLTSPGGFYESYLTPNTLYHFQACAGVGAACGADLTFTTLPNAPISLYIDTVTETSMTLRWSAPAYGASTYKIERCQGMTCTPTQLVDGVSTTYYNNDGLFGNTYYRYRVQASNSTGDGSYSNIVTQKTNGDTPTVATRDATNITSTSFTGNGTIVNVGLDNPERWIVWGTTDTSYGDNPACTASFGQAGPYSCTISNLSPNTTYYYQARANNTVGWGLADDYATTTLPGVPGAITFSAIGANSLSLYWGVPSGGAAYYEVEHCQGSPCTVFNNAALVDTYSFSDDNLNTNTYYKYRVKACNTSGCSGYNTPDGRQTSEQVTSPDAQHNIRGNAHNEHYGKISFNCLDDDPGGYFTYDFPINFSITPCGSNSHGVDIDINNNFSGEAWNKQLGLITFNSTEEPPDPNYIEHCPNHYLYPTSTACYDEEAQKIWGWAQVVNTREWIRFDGSESPASSIFNYNSATPGIFTGYASGGIGVISLNCATPIDTSHKCSVDDYYVYRWPLELKKISAPNWSYSEACSSTAKQAIIQWYINGGVQSAYQVMINNENNTSSPLIDTDRVSGSAKQFICDGACAEKLVYGEHYYTWVRLWNENYSATPTPWRQFDVNNDDILTDNPTANFDSRTFTVYKHEFPVSTFSWSPTDVLVGTSTYFTSASQYYSNDSPYNNIKTCDAGTCSYLWTTSDTSALLSSTSTATSTFNFAKATGTVVSLKTIDSENYYCSTSTILNVNFKLPIWKEIKAIFGATGN